MGIIRKINLHIKNNAFGISLVGSCKQNLVSQFSIDSPWDLFEICYQVNGLNIYKGQLSRPYLTPICESIATCTRNKIKRDFGEKIRGKARANLFSNVKMNSEQSTCVYSPKKEGEYLC